jgi:bifunctional non-homologous end joining protein LigD
MAKAARAGKIYIDFLRNDRGATSVAAYSTRAREGAPVSTPLRWEELAPSIRSDHFHLGNVPQRLATLDADPWDGFFDVRQSISSAAMKKVGL